MKNVNLIEMLHGCSKRNGMAVSASNPDGQPTVNRQSRLMSHRGYLRNLAMIFAVLVMSIANIGMAWGAKASWTSPNQSSLPTSLDDGKISLAWSKNSSSSQTSVIYNGGKSSAVARFFSDGSTLTIGTTSSYKIDSIIITIGNKSSSPAGFKTGGVTTGWSAFNTSGTNKYTVATPSAGNSFVITIYKTGGTLTNGRIDITGIDVYYVSAGGATSHSVSAVTSTGTNTYGTVSAAASSVAEGGTTTITAVPASGYRVTNWAVSGTGASISPTGASNSTTTTLTMGTANATVTVTFGAIPTHTITYTNTKSMDNSANPTSYYEGVGVASFTKLRHAVGYDFTGWSPSSISSSATTNQTIDAQWTARAAAAGTGTLTYALAFGSGTITTSSITRVNGALYDATDISLAHTTFADNANKTGCSGKLTTTSTKSGTNYVETTFKIADGYTFTPTEVRVQGIAVSNDKTIEVELTDNAATPNTKSVSGTLTAVNSPTTGGYTVTLDFDASGEITLEGTVTVKIFAYGAADHWRMGTPFVITGTVASAAPSCTAPSSVSVDATNTNGWRYTIGETIDLTCTAEGGTGTKTYQWQKYIGSSWEDIDGATNARFQKENCTSSDGGSYRCVVTMDCGGDPVASAGYYIRVFTLDGNYYGAGDWIKNAITWTGANTGYVRLHLEKNKYYKFKITDNDGKWFGEPGTITGDITSAWDFNTDKTSDCTLNTNTNFDADYVIYLDITYALNGEPPTVKVTATFYRTYYMQLCSDWKADDAKYALHYWKNGEDGSGWSDDFMEATDCDEDILFTTIPARADRCIFVRFNPAKTSTGNWDDNYNQTGELTIQSDKDYYKSLSKGGENKYYGSWDVFSETKYTISFDAGDGDGSMSAIEGICAGNNQALTANSFTAPTGYEFDAWHADENVTVSSATVSAGSDIADEATLESLGSDVTLTAQWKPKTYTITLAKGDHGAVNQSATVNYNATAVTSITDVTSTGYDLTGYYDGSTKVLNADGSFASSTVSGYITSSKWTKADNCILTAKWTAKTYDVTLNDQDATTSVSPSKVTATYNSSTIDAITNPGKTGYTFGGWYKSEAGADGLIINTSGALQSGTDYTDGSGNWTNDDDATVYAKWTQTVTLHDNHGGSNNGSVSVTYKGSAGTPSAPSAYSGHTQDGGYYAESSCTNKVMALNGTLQASVTDGSSDDWTNSSSKWAHAGASTLYAHWKCNTPTITDNGNNTVTITVPSGTTVRYTTDGTDPSSSSGTVYSTTFSIAANCTVKAIAYQTNCTDSEIASKACDYSAPATLYTVTFNTNGGSSQSSITQASEGASITMPSEPTKSGYTFQGWVIGSTTKDASASYTPTANVTAYASWKTNCSDGATTTTTFNFNTGNATGLTIASSGSNASYSIVNATTQNIPVLDSYFLASSFTDNSSGVITITTNDSYTNIDSIKFNSASTDNSNPKIAVYGVKKDGTDSIQLKSNVAMSSGTTKTWRAAPYTVDIHGKSPKYSGKVRFKLTTGSSGKHAGLDNIVIYNTGGGGGTCYYVTYNGNGAATGFTADETAYGVSSGTTVTVKANGAGGAAYAKSGYIFSGWNTKSDGTGTSFKAGDTFTISKDTILYAQWADPSSGDCFYIDDAKKKSNYSVSVGGTFDDTKLNGSITGGTVTNTSTADVSFSGNDKYGIIFDASTKKITVRLSSGTLKSGATIKIGGYTNNSKSQTCGFKVSGNDCSPASVATTSGNSSYNFFTQTYTVAAADGVIGTDSFSITLVDDKTYLDSLYVSGCDDCTEGGLSYATASVTKTICDAAFTNTLSNSNSLTGITYSSTNTSVATVESDGEVTIVGTGTTTIKATAAAQSTYCASEATYSLTVNSGTAAGLSFATASYSKATDDEGFTQTVTNPNSLTGVTYSSSNPSVATVNETTGAVTLVSTGSTTITARTAAQTVSTTCYAADSASYTISVSGSASCTTLPDYIWKTGSTYTPVGTSHTYEDGDYNAIDNCASATTHISISGSNHVQKSGSLNIGKSKDNYFLITAASGYVIDSIYFYGKMEDGECRMTTDNSSWDAYNAGQTTEKAFAIGVGTQYFGIKNKDTGGDSPKGVWIRTMRIKVCSASAKYTVTFNMNGHGDAIAATTNITPNTTISAPSDPSAECYTFGGWYKEAACTNVWTFASDKVTNNMTLYAKWTSNKAQVASTDYGKLVYTVTPAGKAEALSVTPVDATGVTYKWLEYTSDDVSSATTVEEAATASYSPSIATAGTKYYWAVLVHSCGNDTTDAFRIVVNAAKTNPTIAWGDVQLGDDDATPTYGGGGYTLTGTINDGDVLTPTLTTDMITAGEGIVITSKSVNDASKTFSLTFGLTAAFDTTQAKLTDIHFELPGNATYNDSLFATNLDYDKCSSGSTSTDVYVVGKSNSTGTGLGSAAYKALKTANTWRSTSSPTFTDKTSADEFSISATDAGKYWAQSTQTFVATTSGATMRAFKLGTKSATITWTNSSLSFSKVRIIGINVGSAASTVSVSNGTTSENFTFAKSDAIQVKEVSLDFTYGDKKGVRFTTTDAKELNVLIELVPTGSDGAGTGTTTTLEWKSGYAPSDISGWDGTAKKIVKAQADANFSVVAQQTSATNSLGAITYSSNNEEVATVNSTTGEVNIVAGASGGEATITAEMARSGCYKKATLSYIINVHAQACDIKAGSIAATSSSTISVSNGTATKCSTEAVTLTISGHTTSNTTVTWWKDGVQVVDDDNIYNIEGATLATKAEGTYNAKVTGATCAVATNNIKVVDRSASVSVTKLVNQWYIKNGRVTPDIPLFKLGDGCSFVGAKADDEDLTDELGGCTVYQKAGSDTVFLQGKAPSGMTVGNVSLQIVVEDVCGNTETSAAITIHKQVATDKHELAFVVAGTNYAKKTFSEDAWTDGIKASQSTGLALYQVLKDTFKILATNIYATDSIPLIREYYSQFDLICITDYPNTGTKGKNGSSYVDAIGGAMIDVRPLLTMEAYVSGLDNWRAKGVIGSRTTPSKRQYNMMLQCKDHEIFEGTTLKQFGYGDDALFQVNIVDSTAHRYTDLDATSKSTHASDTAALQGFTVGEMKDLLPLGTTDNGSGTDLQVGVERQKVMTARMMVLGINSYAMERLSKDGKQIVVNALQYLTKKRSEDISDCSSYFTNDAGDNKWENPLNWRSGTVPTSNQEARITQPVTVSDTRKIASVKIATDGTFRDVDVDGSLTIASTGMLIVTDRIQAVTGPDFMNGFATSEKDITIEASSTKQGALILNNEEGTTKATVQMYSKAGYDNDGVTPNFAYVGVPVSGMTLGSAFPGAEVWYYDEGNPYWWSRSNDSETSDAHFLTYCISHWAPETFELSGTLAPTGTQNMTLSVHSGGVEGDNMIANSWTAPIDIAQFETADFDGAAATLYMYLTGHDDERGVGEEGTTAGKWVSVTVDAAKTAVWPEDLRMIPSMQAFCITVASTHTLTMDYDRLVRANAYLYENGEGQATILAPKRRMAKAEKVDPAEVEGLRLVVSGQTTGYDVYLFAHPAFSEAFDNGWDARHMEGGELSNPLLCVPSELGNLDIAAIPELAGQVLKFVPSSEREYTFSMTYEGDNELYLNDIKLEKSTRIQTGNTYDFVWENGDGQNRFMISATPFNAPLTPTGVTNLDGEMPKAQKIIYNDKMYIMINGRVYSADGALVK